MSLDAAAPVTTQASLPRAAATSAHDDTGLLPTGGVGAPVLAAALLVGITGDVLLRQVPWGLNLPIAVLALVVSLMVLARRFGADTRSARWLGVEAVAFASALVWRASVPLMLLNVLAVATALLLMPVALAPDGPGLLRARVRDYVYSAFLGVKGALADFMFLLLNDVRFTELTGGQRARHLGGVARGLLLALPLLFVFGALFASADIVFERALQRVFRVDLELVMSHVLLGAFLTWLAGGYLRATVLSSRRERWAVSGREGEADAVARLGVVEVSVILGLLNLLFLSFVAVQVGYLFGGQAFVQRSAGLTYAAYARRGFFELMFVAILALPVVLGANALLRRQRPADERIFRGLATTLIVLLFVIMLSAVNRLRLYVDQFGLTESRLYAAACMLWLAVVFVWFGATVLRGRMREFAVGALAAGGIVLGTLNAIDPDRLIVRTNVQRLSEGRELDVRYIAYLGDDAIPPLLEVYPRLTADQQCHVRYRVGSLLQSLEPASDGTKPLSDWRSWNLGRTRARDAVARHAETLRAAECDGTHHRPGYVGAR